MKRSTRLTFKVASDDAEFDQMHRLNYRTFVEEIPQHDPNPGRRLIDRFDPENTYIICLKDKKLLGMVAVRGQRPFSLDQKLGDLNAYLPRRRSICEIRLLAVEQANRNGIVFRGLAKLLVQHCKQKGYDLAIISGALSQQRLYSALGFTPFGPIVGSGKARFQPMYLSLENFEKHGQPLLATSSAKRSSRRKTILLPGPVAVSSEVRKAFIGEPVSHRSEPFMRDVHSTQKLLCDLVNAQRVEIFLGSGTLANDVVAGQISLQSAHGLVLANGEFGSRLIDHARRFGLSFQIHECAWGEPFDWARIRRQLDRRHDLRWIWAVHCETSTGMLNDLAKLKELSAARGLLLCLDCISSIGTVPVDLTGVHLASGVSGKGLGSLPGLSVVFYQPDVSPAPRELPRYLDLGLYAAEGGVPFTTSSNLLYALRAALLRFNSAEPYQPILDASRRLRARLRALGFEMVIPDEHSSPAVITLRLPPEFHSAEVGELLEREGYWLSYKSRYLLERNWLQVCLMGECAHGEMAGLLEALQRCCDRKPLPDRHLPEPSLSSLSSPSS